MSKKIFKLSLSLLAVVVLLSACTLPWKKKVAPGGGEATPSGDQASHAEDVLLTNTSRLKKFSNYEELAKFLAENSNPEMDATRGLMVDQAITKTAAPMAQSLNAAASGVSASEGSMSASDNSGVPNNSLDYSGTNNQVQGVDEADIIKTDGNYIYALVKNELSIIKATPASDANVVSKITFKSRPQDIFIDGQFLAVFGSDSQIYTQAIYQTFRRQNSYTFFKVFDISDPANPKQVRDLDFEGSYFDARLIGDYVYFITNTYNSYVTNEPLVPRVLENGQALSLKCEADTRCFAPDVYYFDIPYDSYSFTNITAINIKNNTEAISGQAYLLNNGQNLYVSQKNIYITYTQYLNEYDLEQAVKKELIQPKLSAEDQDKIVKIEAAPNFVLNNNEKKVKIAQIIDRYLASLDSATQSALSTEIDSALQAKLTEKAKEMEKTVIHKIAVNGNKIEYRAMGEVTGHVLNQFSMDENDDYFRLATTRSQQWSRLNTTPTDSFSNIYVLDTNLKPVGSLENIATTERIYAARFIGGRVYLVTFKQTDPLFVISLADPAKPTVLGAIKIPGFSNYLHPVDKDGKQLIGLGRQTEETATGGVKVKGLKLSLFDFSDLSKPKELDNYLIGDSSSDSIALQDHKAFLFSAGKNILSIPAVLRENGRLSFAGALVFKLDNNSFTLQGKIDHSAGGHFGQSDYWNGFSYYDNTVKRSLYIGDQLFTFSNKFLKINSLGDLKETKSLELTSGGDDYIITPVPTPVSAPMSGTTEPSSPASTSLETLPVSTSSPALPPSVQ
jgi:uncharacterized secreted protein with C-terminal beta-propeller domain